MKNSLNQLRKEYAARALDEGSVSLDPIEQFGHWIQEAIESSLVEPNAMTLATASADGRPSARMVLLKECNEKGFTFFTNYESRKGRELAQNPWAALVFYWPELERQVRVEGRTERVSALESDLYFQRRPREARLGAWASRQGEVVASRGVIEKQMQEVSQRYMNLDSVPRPDSWGGYRLTPDLLEFWQGRPHRLHDRLRYQRDDQRVWVIERLSP